jgi:hypothetical protein
MALFSPRVYMPAFLATKLPVGNFPLDYGNHAREEQKNDRFGELVLPESLDTSKAEVIEVELIGKDITKVVYRMPMDKYRDISLAVIPGKKMFVKTVWSNPWNDNHKTLKTGRYAQL